MCRNPYFTGKLSAISRSYKSRRRVLKGHNPCFTGKLSAIHLNETKGDYDVTVVILVLLENSLQYELRHNMIVFLISRNPCFTGKLSAITFIPLFRKKRQAVAILVLLENSLQSFASTASSIPPSNSRNPCFTGKLSAIKFFNLLFIHNIINMSQSLFYWKTLCNTMMGTLRNPLQIKKSQSLFYWKTLCNILIFFLLKSIIKSQSLFYWKTLCN